jgi:hypothetical protein
MKPAIIIGRLLLSLLFFPCGGKAEVKLPRLGGICQLAMLKPGIFNRKSTAKLNLFKLNCFLNFFVKIGVTISSSKILAGAIDFLEL